MNYQLSRLPYSPIILITLDADFDLTTIHTLFEDLVMMLSAIDGSQCLMFDFRQGPALTEQDIAHYAAAFVQGVRRAQTDTPLYLSFISQDDATPRLAEVLQQHALIIPVYDDLDDAHSYLILQVDRDMLRQGRSANNPTQIDRDLLHYSRAIMQKIERARCQFPLGGTLRLEAIELNKSIVVLPQRGILLGRRTPNSEHPDIDLSLWAGYRTGVSRHHARIYVADTGSLRLVDLGSSNGTFLNEMSLEPNHPYGLCNNDRVRLGSLNIRLYFQQSLTGNDLDTQPIEGASG